MGRMASFPPPPCGRPRCRVYIDFKNDSLYFLQWYYTQLVSSFDTPSKFQPVGWRLCALYVPSKYLIATRLYCERISINFRVMRSLLSVLFSITILYPIILYKFRMRHQSINTYLLDILLLFSCGRQSRNSTMVELP